MKTALKLGLVGWAAALLLALALVRVPLAHAQTATCDQTYVVQPGDSLSTIAQKLLGDLKAYNQIVEATNDAAKTDTSFATITDPNQIEVGQKLCIPKATGAAATSAVTTTVTTTTPTTTTTAVPAPLPTTGMAGIYLAAYPAADASALLYTLDLAPDSNATLTKNYVGRTTIAQKGTWTQFSATGADVYLTQQEEQRIGVSFIFELQGDTLAATQFDKGLYGESGLTLLRATGVVTGVITYTQRLTLPDNGVVEVYLLDVSEANKPGKYLSGVSYTTHGKQAPLSFEVPYAPSQINANNKYVVQAFISAAGQLLFKHSNGVAVLTGGAPTSNVSITVDPTNP